MTDLTRIGWDDPHNAKTYDDFARKHDLYRDTSRDLVELAALSDAALVVDLACGTGVTTEAVLERVGPNTEVVGVDGSEAMLDIARRTVTDPRVRWVQARAIDLPQHVSGAEAIVSNSAIWQLDMANALEAAGRALRKGGRLVFNIGRQFLILPFTPEELQPSKPSLTQLIQAIAILDHDFAPAHHAGRGGGLTPDSITDMIERAGLEPTGTHTFEYANTPESQLAWLRVPVFAQNVLPGMPHEEQLVVLDKAYERFDKTQDGKNLWMAFVAVKP